MLSPGAEAMPPESPSPCVGLAKISGLNSRREDPKMTLGEYRVGISFNPGASIDVAKIKRAAADFIDLCADIRAQHGPECWEIIRLWDAATEQIEDAAMWAVKAATKPKE